MRTVKNFFIVAGLMLFLVSFFWWFFEPTKKHFTLAEEISTLDTRVDIKEAEYNETCVTLGYTNLSSIWATYTQGYKIDYDEYYEYLSKANGWGDNYSPREGETIIVPYWTKY